MIICVTLRDFKNKLKTIRKCNINGQKFCIILEVGPKYKDGTESLKLLDFLSFVTFTRQLFYGTKKIAISVYILLIHAKKKILIWDKPFKNGHGV